MPGVGKDVVAVAVLAQPEVRATAAFSFVPFWAQAETLASLHSKLRQLANDHLGAPSAEPLEACLARIKAWLAKEYGWSLYIEDACPESAAALAALLPEAPRGKVVVTSQAEDIASKLPSDFTRIKLEPFVTAVSMQLLAKMGQRAKIEADAALVEKFLEEETDARLLGASPLDVLA
jgi:hypothetical protein